MLIPKAESSRNSGNSGLGQAIDHDQTRQNHPSLPHPAFLPAGQYQCVRPAFETVVFQFDWRQGIACLWL
jgi:hypothetical protein